MINRIMTPRAAAVALAASALIAAPVLADEGEKTVPELRGGPASENAGKVVTGPAPAHTRPNRQTYDDDRGYGRGRDRPYNQPDRHVRSDRYGNPVIRCASGDYRLQYCQAPYGMRIREVRLIRQRSSADCAEGYSWGHDRNTIWVTNGCRADFALISRRSGYGPYAGDHGRGRGYSDDRQDLRRMKRQAVRKCERRLERRADRAGWRHAEFTRRPRVDYLGHRKFRVRGTVHLGQGYNETRQDITCVVRRGEVRRFTELYPAYDNRNYDHDDDYRYPDWRRRGVSQNNEGHRKAS